MYRVFRYRKEIILGNLKQCFQEMSDEERKNMLIPIYKNLTDVIIEGMKSFTIRRGQVIKRHKILNPDFFQQYIDKGQSIIAITAHYNNWEWGSLSAGQQVNMNVVGFYKPLNNQWVNRFLKWSRSRSGTILAPINQTTTTFDRYANQSTIFLMAADQNPSNTEKAYWVNFLGQETAFLHGPEKHAKRKNLPIAYIDIKRDKRGYYSIEMSELIKNPLDYSDGEITQAYANKVEEMIRRYPANWLWSHKRWKHKSPNIPKIITP